MGYVFRERYHRYDYFALLERAAYSSGVCQREAAEALGIKQQSLNYILHGCSKISREYIWTLARLYDINIIEWCITSAYVFDRVWQDLSPYALSVIKAATGIGPEQSTYTELDGSDGAFKVFRRPMVVGHVPVKR